MNVPEPQYGPAALLNRTAGDYPVVTDPQELGAAARAGDRSFEEFPYYEARYDGRGRLFGRSDSAWLLTLCDADPRFALEQVGWLGRVLSSRGMPQWLLERHLLVLHEELARALPEQAERYAFLRSAAEWLRGVRHSHLPEERLAELEARFDALAGPEWARRLPRTGALLAAAVADERAGIGNAVDSVEAWMTSAERFPPAWIDAVRTVLDEARATPSPSAPPDDP